MSDYDLDEALDKARDDAVEVVQAAAESFFEDYEDLDHGKTTPLESFVDHLNDVIGLGTGPVYELYSEMNGKIDAAVTEFFTKIKPLVKKHETNEEEDEEA